MSPSQATTAVEAGLIFLARRSYPEAALRQKLGRMWPSADVDAAMVRLRELGMIDDDAWARRFTRSRFERGGNGRHRIAAELSARGIPQRRAVEIVDEEIDHRAERRSAATLLSGFLRRMPAPDDGHTGAPTTVEDLPEQERARLFRRMVARGYPAGLVRDLLAVS